MGKLTKYTSFDALKTADNALIIPVANKQELDAEVRQAAVILNKLRAQRRQGDVR